MLTAIPPVDVSSYFRFMSRPVCSITWMQGLFNGEEEIDLPERAHKAVGYLRELRAMMAGICELASRDPDVDERAQIETTFERLRELTRIMETEINEAVSKEGASVRPVGQAFLNYIGTIARSEKCLFVLPPLRSAEAYTQLHGRPPGEADLQQYFRVCPPSGHQMVLTPERNGLIERQPGVARSIQLLAAPDDPPILRRAKNQPVKFSVQNYWSASHCAILSQHP